MYKFIQLLLTSQNLKCVLARSDFPLFLCDNGINYQPNYSIHPSGCKNEKKFKKIKFSKHFHSKSLRKHFKKLPPKLGCHQAFGIKKVASLGRGVLHSIFLLMSPKAKKPKIFSHKRAFLFLQEIENHNCKRF